MVRLEPNGWLSISVSAAAGETKGNGGEFSGWEFSNVPAITPVTTAGKRLMALYDLDEAYI